VSVLINDKAILVKTRVLQLRARLFGHTYFKHCAKETPESKCRFCCHAPNIFYKPMSTKHMKRQRGILFEMSRIFRNLMQYIKRTWRHMNGCNIMSISWWCRYDCTIKFYVFCCRLAKTPGQSFFSFSTVILGEVKTFQRGDLGRHGMFFKIVPKYSYKRHKNQRHFQGCWKRYGTKARKAKAQSILPCNAAWPFKSRLEDFKVNNLIS